MRGKAYPDYFGGGTAKGRKQYRQFVYNGLDDDLQNPLESGKCPGIVGSDSFVDKIREKYLGRPNT